MEIRHIQFAFLVLGLLFFGCNQTGSNNSTDKNKMLTNEAEDQTKQQNKAFENEKLEDYKIDSIKKVIELFKEKNIDKISSKISFPLYRQYPIPPIKNKEELKKRFSEVFDQILIDKIVYSEIGQWSEVGWRGITLDNGVLWMANSDGIITSVNYQSDFEKKLLINLIDKEKENLHSSLKTFEIPIYKIKTKNYLIRIDELANYKYRYASWKIGAKETSEPDIILKNGELEFLGSGGNQVICFVQGEYTYKVYRNIIGEDDMPDITLEVEKDGQIILTEDGELIID